MSTSMLTVFGAQRVAQAIANGTKITVSEIVIGDGPPSGENIGGTQVYSIHNPAVKIDPDVPNVINISGVIPVNVGGFVIGSVAVKEGNNVVAYAAGTGIMKPGMDDPVPYSHSVVFLLAVSNSAAFEVTQGGGILDAPQDGKTYGRRDGVWEEIPTGGGGQSQYVTVGVKIDTANSDPGACVTYVNEQGGAIAAPTADITALISGVRLVNKPTLNLSGMSITGDVAASDTVISDNGSQNSAAPGTDAFARIPKIGLKMSKVNDVVTLYLTNDPNAGSRGFSYHAHSRLAEGDRNYVYVGAYLASADSGLAYSVSGAAPTPSLPLETWRAYAQGRGGNGSGNNRWGYDQVGWYQLLLLQALYTVIFKNLDGQSALGRGYVDGNSANTPTGNTNGKSGTRTAPNVTGRDGLFYGEDTGLGPNANMKFLGIEDFWGNLRWWVEGCSTDETRALVTRYTGYSSTAGDAQGSKHTGGGIPADISGYITRVAGDEHSGFAAEVCGGTETAYFADYGCRFASRVSVVGGAWTLAGTAGPFYVRLDYGAALANSSIGARLMLL